MKTVLPILLAIAAVTTWITLAATPSKSSITMQTPTTTTVRLVDSAGTPGEPLELPTVNRSEAEWRLRLTPEQFKIGREHGTERAFCGVFHDNKKDGLYTCAGCGLPLFESSTKFDSGTGWPSFFQPVASENVGSTIDRSYGMVREEVHCARCGTHLGHVFPDGPPPTGKRYCINSAVLDFHQARASSSETVYFGAGCFWGVESAFSKLPGVLSTEVGYAGGHTANPTYDDVCGHNTGHAEVVKVVYDPGSTSFDKLLDAFWTIHDHTTLNRQGPDIGDQYRSAIFFTTPAQESAARAAIAQLNQSGRWNRPIVTQVDLAPPYFRAEEYHQKYSEKHGGAACNIGL